ncbi:hypothetical protein PAXINDRAFT_21119, partial [Paxillus involutus ATCC 200175]
MAEIPQLRADAQQNLDRLYDGTETLQGDAEDWQQRNAIAKALIVNTIPDSIFLRILHYESAHQFFEALKNLFEKDIATLELLQELRNNRSKHEATYGLESANDRIRRRSHVTDASRCDDDVSNRSVRRNDHVPNGNTRRPERKREATSQRRVERRRGVGEEGRVSKGEKDDEQVAAASGVSLVNPTSSQGHLPRARVDTPQPHPTSTSPPSTPSMPVEQTAPTSRRPTRQRRRDGHVLRTGTRRTREDVEEAVDEDGEDVHVHHAHVEPQQPQTTRQTAVDDEATDTTDPHANSAGPAVPVGTTNGPPNESNGGRDRERGRNVEEEDEKGGRASESAALSSNDDGGDEDVRHAYVVPKPASPSPNHVPPPPDESRPPPSMSLEGEMSGKQSSDHADEAATHHEHPRHESTTTPPIRTPRDEKSSGEGRGTAMSHREAVGGDDEVEGSNDGRETSYRVEETPNEVEGSNDDRDTSYGDDERRCRREKARDEARDDEEGQQNRERGQTTEERRTAATNANDEDDSPRPSLQAPSPPPPPLPNHPIPPHPEQREDDVDTTKSNKTPARRHADAVHDPGDETDAPDSVPPSVRLEGERNRRTSLNVDVDVVETDDNHAEDDDHTQQPSRHPVGTPDGDLR